MDDDYKCTLDEKSLKVAKDELHEDPKERNSTVETFRRWIHEHPHIMCEPTTPYLLWFLRAAKFSQLEARTKLEKFLNALDEYPEWIRNIDFSDEKMIKFYRSGYIVPLGKDNSGRCVLLYRLSCLDVANTPKSIVMKGLFGLIFHLSKDEGYQVNGYTYILDCTGFEMKHLTFFGLDDMKKLTKLWQGVLPGRFKAFHYYNTGAVFDTMMAAIMPIMQKKLKERINIHGSNLENVYKHFPMELFPEEYLPDDYEGNGPIQGLIDKLITDLTRPEVVGQIKRETGPLYGIDKSKRFSDEPQASFRKLNVE